MKRLTKKIKKHSTFYDCDITCNQCFNGCKVTQMVLDRLAAIEDILGDRYKLDRLRELVEADRVGHCVVFDLHYPVVSEYYKDEDGRFIRETSGVISEAEYETALKARDQDGQ